MSKRSRRPGQNIRELAFKRRVKAIASFVAAGLIVFMPILLKEISIQLSQLVTNNPSSQSRFSLELPASFYILFLLIALGFAISGVSLWKRANRAVQGARGEEAIGQELAQLEREGWTIEYGMRLGNKLGDADVVCQSPHNKAYVIDVKSHRGEVTVDSEKLRRRLGGKYYSFEKDFIAQVMKQALQVRRQRDLKFVTPILAFSEAKVFIPSGKLREVYVVEKSRLVPLLKSLG